jgi:hypothetical protein
VRRVSSRAVFGVALCVAALGCGSKKEEAPPVPAAPPPGAANREELTTSLGQARGLDEGLAPSAVKWTRVVVLDNHRALIAGDVVNETIALYTEDAGKTWRSGRAERDAWAQWSASLDGAIVLASGARAGAAGADSARADAARMAFGSLDADGITTSTPLFSSPKWPLTGIVQTASAVPALLGPGSAALVVSDGARKGSIVYGGKPGADAVAPVDLPAGEKFVPVPYARPPQLLSIKGRDLLQRPFPLAGKPLDKPQKVVGLAPSPTLLAELSTAPACEMGPMTLQRISGAGKKPQLFGLAPGKLVTFALPDGVTPTTAIGCGANRIVVEAIQAKTGAPALQAQQPDMPLLLTCDLAGKCTTPKNAPFRLWPGPQKREIAMTATERGTLGVLSARAGDRWGMYLAQAADGIMFERPRVIGEGNTERGRIELGALLSFGSRALLLISADVTGTSRRGWFVLATDDGGTSWNPP